MLNVFTSCSDWIVWHFCKLLWIIFEKDWKWKSNMDSNWNLANVNSSNIWKTWKISPWIPWQTHSFFFHLHTDVREFFGETNCVNGFRKVFRLLTHRHHHRCRSHIKLICNLFQYASSLQHFTLLFPTHSLPRQLINLFRRAVLSCVENRRWMRRENTFYFFLELSRTLCQIFWQKAFVTSDFTQHIYTSGLVDDQESGGNVASISFLVLVFNI